MRRDLFTMRRDLFTIKKLTVILLLFIIIIIAAVNFYRKNDFRTLKKPDKIELDIPKSTSILHYEFEPGDTEYNEIYRLVKKDWDRTIKQDHGEMIYLQLDYLDEKRDYTGTTIHFYYEKAQDWGKRNRVEHAHYYSFFPYTLEYAAITQNKDYYKKANLPHFQSDNELKHYIDLFK